MENDTPPSSPDPKPPAPDPLAPIGKITSNPKPPADPADPPPADPPPAAKPPEKTPNEKTPDIRNFEPKPFKLDLTEDPKPDPEPKKDAPPASKPDPKDPPAADDLPQAPPELRARLKEVQDQASGFEVELKTVKTENDTLQARIDEMQEKLATSEKSLADMQEQRGMLDPTQHPEVQKLVTEREEFEAGFNREIRALASEMGGDEGERLFGSQGEAFGRLVQAYAKVGQIGDDGYRARHEEFKDYIDEQFPENSKEVMRALRKGVEAFSTSANMASREEALMKEIGAKGAEWQHGEQAKQYDEVMGHYSQVEKQWFTPQPDQAENDPTAPRVMLAKLIEDSPEVKQRSTEIRKMLKEGLTPLAPLTAEQLGTMSDADAQEYMERRMQDKKVVQNRLQNMAGEAYLSLAIMPSIIAERDELRAELNGLRDRTPEPGGEDSDIPPASQSKSIRDFEPAPFSFKL